MRPWHKIRKLFSTDALASLREHAKRWTHPVNAKRILATIDPAEIARITEHYPRRLFVTEERLTDEEPGRTVAEAVTAALQRHQIAHQLRRQQQDKELVFAYLGLTTQERRACQ